MWLSSSLCDYLSSEQLPLLMNFSRPLMYEVVCWDISVCFHHLRSPLNFTGITMLHWIFNMVSVTVTEHYLSMTWAVRGCVFWCTWYDTANSASPCSEHWQWPHPSHWSALQCTDVLAEKVGLSDLIGWIAHKVKDRGWTPCRGCCLAFFIIFTSSSSFSWPDDHSKLCI